MDFGASTSCYYPLETELALAKVIHGGFACTEIFFNTYTEILPDFVKQLAGQAKAAGVSVTSVHPFTSFAETTCLFGDYPRRADDFLELYRRYFYACNLLGAKILVLHGALRRAKTKVPLPRYLERYRTLVELGKQFGVTVAQENVNLHFSETPAFLSAMKAALGADFKMVLDVKQARRAGFDPFAMAEQFGPDIVHVHISDHDGRKDCVPPGRGAFDFAKLARIMEQAQYSGKYMIEIYQDDYDVEMELASSKRFLEQIK